MNEIKLLKSIYNKEAILYSLNLYLNDKEYELGEDSKYFLLQIKDINLDDFKMIKEEINFNALRFEIADKNKDMRKNIISQALGSVNY